MIVVTIAMEVIRRFVLSYSSIWGEEIARYAFIYLAWIGAAAAVKDRAHIRIDVCPHRADRLGHTTWLPYRSQGPTLPPQHCWVTCKRELLGAV